MAPPAIAILGAGIFAKEGLLHYYYHCACTAYLPALAELAQSSEPSFELRAIYSRSLSSAQSLASAAYSLFAPQDSISLYHDDESNPANTLQALLARPDISAVLLILPINLQPTIILSALSANKHVLSEKPIAPTVADARSLINTYDSTYKPRRLLWRVAENYEAEPGYRKAAEIVSSGKIGEVTAFEARVVNYIDKTSKWYNTPWRTVPDYQGGFLLDGGVHTAALLRTVLQSTPTSLTAFSSLTKSFLTPSDTINALIRFNPIHPPIPPVPVNDQVQVPTPAPLTQPPHGILQLSFSAPTPSRSSYNSTLFTGTKGYLEISNKDSESVPVVRLTTRTAPIDPDTSAAGPEVEDVIDVPRASIREELAHFLKLVASNPVAGTDLRAQDGANVGTGTEAVTFVGDEGLGEPSGAIWDVAIIEAALTSGGNQVDLEELVKG